MRRGMTALFVMVALVAAACGGDTAGDTTTTLDSTTTTSPARSTTTTAPATTTTTDPPQTTTTTLAGEEIEFGPGAGDVVMVIGVRHDDVLNLRAGPGAGQPILDEIPPTYTDLVAQGHTRDLSPSFWIEVDYEGTVGWVHMSFIAFEGVVTDETSLVIDELGERPVAPSMTGLGEMVAEVFDSDEEPESVIVQVTPVTTGDLSEVTYDVVGLGDDSVRGLRLHVLAEDTGDGFSLRSVEVTGLCGRGVTDDGLCT